MFKLNETQEFRRKELETKYLEEIYSNFQDKRYENYHYPRTAAEWWSNVDVWWDDLIKIAARWIDISQFEYEEWKTTRNPKLAEFFGTVWFATPDHGSIHCQKAWDVLCDLCSENYVLTKETLDKNPDSGDSLPA